METQTQMEMEASSHVQRKCKEREIRKHSKSIFPRWPTMIALLRFTRVRSEHKYWLKKMKMFLLLGLTLAFAFAFALGGSHDQFLAFAIAFC